MWKGDACLAVEAPGSVVVDVSPHPQLGPKVEETTSEVRIDTLSANLPEAAHQSCDRVWLAVPEAKEKVVK